MGNKKLEFEAIEDYSDHSRPLHLTLITTLKGLDHVQTTVGRVKASARTFEDGETKCDS